MIRAEELRIGNLVYFNGRYKEIGKVTAIATYESGHVNVSLNGRKDISYTLKEISSIELTEEILVEWCGCKKYGERIWINEINHLFLIWDGSDYCLCHHREPEYVRAYVSTLHHWQNIIHALTGQELPINIKTN